MRNLILYLFTSFIIAQQHAQLFDKARTQNDGVTPTEHSQKYLRIDYD